MLCHLPTQPVGPDRIAGMSQVVAGIPPVGDGVHGPEAGVFLSRSSSKVDSQRSYGKVMIGCDSRWPGELRETTCIDPPLN